MKILLTNNTLQQRAGTELYVRDVALKLQREGHTPFVYSAILGDVANEIRAATIPVVSDLKSLSIVPDIIHGQHHLETMTALLHFPKVPAVYFCHGWKPWQEAPPPPIRIYKYVAVDEAIQDQLLFERGIPENRVRIIFNFVDLTKFKERLPLPKKPRRALFFSNYASENNVVPLIRETCKRARIDLDVVGERVQNPTAHPETILGKYDIVFARGRSAIEAMAVGAAVILLDTKKTGPMVTLENFDRLRRLNFGMRAREEQVNSEALLREIDRYNPENAASVSKKIREIASLDGGVREILTTYQEVIDEHRQNPQSSLEDELREASRYLQTLAPRLKENEELQARLQNQSPPLVSWLKKRIKRLLPILAAK